MRRNFFGTDIMILESEWGDKKHLKYSWVASTNINWPKFIFLHRHGIWKQQRSPKFIRRLVYAISHETIHQVIWHLEGKDVEGYDYLQIRFKKIIKADDSLEYWKYYYVF